LQVSASPLTVTNSAISAFKHQIANNNLFFPAFKMIQQLSIPAYWTCIPGVTDAELALTLPDKLLIAEKILRNIVITFFTADNAYNAFTNLCDQYLVDFIAPPSDFLSSIFGDTATVVLLPRERYMRGLKYLDSMPVSVAGETFNTSGFYNTKINRRAAFVSTVQIDASAISFGSVRLQDEVNQVIVEMDIPPNADMPAKGSSNRMVVKYPKNASILGRPLRVKPPPFLDHSAITTLLTGHLQNTLRHTSSPAVANSISKPVPTTPVTVAQMTATQAENIAKRKQAEIALINFLEGYAKQIYFSEVLKGSTATIIVGAHCDIPSPGQCINVLDNSKIPNQLCIAYLASISFSAALVNDQPTIQKILNLTHVRTSGLSVNEDLLDLPTVTPETNVST
jgi:hypothetical protein